MKTILINVSYLKQVEDDFDEKSIITPLNLLKASEQKVIRQEAESWKECINNINIFN